MSNLVKVFMFAVALLFTSEAMAGNDFKVWGAVSKIDLNAKTFMVTEDETGNTFTFKVTPKTEFEIKNKKNFLVFDDEIPFDDLKVGDWVEVEIKRHHDKGMKYGMAPEGDSKGKKMMNANKTTFTAGDVEVYR